MSTHRPPEAVTGKTKAADELAPARRPDHCDRPIPDAHFPVRQSHLHLLASSGLVLAAALIVTSCMSRLGTVADPAGTLSRQTGHTGRVQPPLAGPTGNVAVQIAWPSADREVGFLYGGGSKVSAVEVFLYDAYGNYHDALIARNTYVNGNAAGTASVTFGNVPAGPAIVSVHTSIRNPLASDSVNPVLIKPSLLSSRSYTVLSDDGGTELRTIDTWEGDQASQFVVFDSARLVGSTGAGSPSVFLTKERVYKTRTTNANEMQDPDQSIAAGYGTGFNTATVPAGGTVNVVVTVSQPPSFDASLPRLNGDNNSSFSVFVAGTNAMTLPARNVLATDVLLATDDVLPDDKGVYGKADVVDLARIPAGATYSMTAVSASNFTFTTTKAFPGGDDGSFKPRNLYLLRGTFVSLLHRATRREPQALVIPAIYSGTQTKVVQPANESLAANTTSSGEHVIEVKDAYGNPICNLTDPLAGPNFGIGIVGSVTPTAIAVDTFLVPRKTTGGVLAFALKDKTGAWKAKYKQGTVGATSSGASNNTGIQGSSGATRFLNRLHLPYTFSVDAAGNEVPLNSKVCLTVQAQGTDTLVEMFNDATASAAYRFASRLLGQSENAATDSLLVTSTLGGFRSSSLRVTSALAAGDNGITFDITNSGNYGSRKVGDQDTVTITLTASGGASFSRNGAVYTWQ